MKVLTDEGASGMKALTDEEASGLIGFLRIFLTLILTSGINTAGMSGRTE